MLLCRLSIRVSFAFCNVLYYSLSLSSSHVSFRGKAPLLRVHCCSGPSSRLNMTPALPSSDQVLASIRTSCARLTESSGLKVSSEQKSECEPTRGEADPGDEQTQINDDAIDKFLSQLNESDINGEAAAQQHGIRLPLQYDSPEAELNMLWSVRTDVRVITGNDPDIGLLHISPTIRTFTAFCRCSISCQDTA